MQLSATCDLTFLNDEPIPLILMLRPRSGAGQWVSAESYESVPTTGAIEYVDVYGNLCQRIQAPAGEFRISASAIVHVADEIERDLGPRMTPIELIPDGVLHFLLPSRYCESDKLGILASEIAANAAPGYEEVESIRRWIHTNILYTPGASNSSTSALDTLAMKQGVCRDMAHLGISLARALNIPARMVVGYLERLEPMDLHAWFEAYIGDRWYVFDSMEEQTRAGRIVIGYGRDAADVALATQFGPSKLSELKVRVERLEPLLGQEEVTL